MTIAGYYYSNKASSKIDQNHRWRCVVVGRKGRKKRVSIKGLHYYYQTRSSLCKHSLTICRFVPHRPRPIPIVSDDHDRIESGNAKDIGHHFGREVRKAWGLLVLRPFFAISVAPAAATRVRILFEGAARAKESQPVQCRIDHHVYLTISLRNWWGFTTSCSFANDHFYHHLAFWQ